MWSRVKNGPWRECEFSGLTGFRSHVKDGHALLAALRRIPESLEEVEISYMTLDADIMRELGRFKSLTSLSVDFFGGTLLPLPPALTTLHWNRGAMDMRDVLPAIAKSNITALWLDRVFIDHALLAATIETSKLKRVWMLSESAVSRLTDRDVAHYVAAAEKCDVECINFWRQTGHKVDLRRTRKLIEFGYSGTLYSNGHRCHEHVAQLDAAFTVRRVLAVLSARSGPAERFVRRDGDHACMARVFRFL